MSSSERPSKQQAFLALLREGWTSLHLDARRAGVVVPQPLRGEPHLVLQYGHDLPNPIPDLEVDDYGVRATLSFSRAAHRREVRASGGSSPRKRIAKNRRAKRMQEKTSTAPSGMWRHEGGRCILPTSQ